MKNFTLFFLLGLLAMSTTMLAQNPVGAVYAMSNGEGQVDGIVQGPNTIVAYLQDKDGILSRIGDYPTGGNGGDFDGGEGLDPLISAYAITKTNDNRFVLAVNAGSNTVTSMAVNSDYSLTTVNTQPTLDVGPNSIAYVPSRRFGINGLVYVSNISRAEFVDMGEPAQQGSVTGYWLLDNGMLVPIADSRRELANRPSAVQISPDGDFLVVTSINSGSSALANLNEDEVVVYAINADGTLSDQPRGTATSTLRDNAEGRNLPSAIGFKIVGDNYVVVTEAREFRPDGTPPVFPGLQDGSVSTWQIMTDGSLEPINMDVASGVNNTGRTACWLDFSDENTFFVSNAIEAGLASYSFNDGVIELIDQTAAQGIGATGNTTDPAAAFGTTEGWIDLSISDDGRFLYQAYGLTGTVGVFAIDGNELTLLQEVTGDLPTNNIQGIISVGVPSDASNPITARYRVTFDALWNEASHPVDFPADEPNIARFSPVAGLTHNSNVRLFEEGTIASQGLVNISQTGSRDPLDSELADVILSGDGQFYIESGTRVRPSPDTISTTFEISETHPLVSLTSMIAPSPDWIVAVRDLNLLEDGDFVESKIVQFIPYDTGSDSGESYASDNQNTEPREPITLITDGVLANNGEIASIGVWRFERIDSESTCDVVGGTLDGGPFNFCIDGESDFISAATLNLTGQTGDNHQLVITDDQGFIVAFPTSSTDVDFDELGVAVHYIWNLAYADGLRGNQIGNNIADLNGCFSLSNAVLINGQSCDDVVPVGAVYAMTNGRGQVDGVVQGPNSIVAYAQSEDGTLTIIGDYPTGGNGGDFDGGEGLDPLISAYAITKTLDNRFVLAVNAGSNTVTSMAVNPDDYSLTVMDTQSTIDEGPNSIAFIPRDIDGVAGLVYVSNITRTEFLALGEPAQQGSITGYWLLDDGTLMPIEDSRRELANRPSAIQFSPNGDFAVVASINSGSSALASGNEDEIVVYAVNDDGTLSAEQTDGATSTLRDNAEGRNLPSAIGFQIVGDNYVVVTEAREFRPDGTPPIFPGLQDGSVSTWQILSDGSLSAIDLDVASGENNTGRTACWLDFSDENTFFVSNAIEAGLASYSFNDGSIELINQVAYQGVGATGNTTDPAAAFGTTEGWIDLWISDDGRYLYQAYGLAGTIGVFEINGTELTLLQEVTGDLPLNNIQGIVSVGQIDLISSTQDIETISADDVSLSIFPNPSNGENVRVAFTLDQESDYSATIFDVKGQELSSRQITGRGLLGTNVISLSSLPFETGLYLLQLELDNGVVNRKFIIQK
jgi:6-phosphogluconolactonase (cycloisomerase 2 family)